MKRTKHSYDDFKRYAAEARVNRSQFVHGLIGAMIGGKR